MIPLKEFEEFVRKGKIRKQKPDFERCKALIKESKDKKKFFDKIISSMPFHEVNSNYIVETSYDILIELIRAKLLSKGFKSSGGGAHEAEISFMRDIGFSEAEVRFMNELRYFRNGIKYYGKIFEKDYARKVMGFLNKSLRKLKSI